MATRMKSYHQQDPWVFYGQWGRYYDKKEQDLVGEVLGRTLPNGEVKDLQTER